MIINIMLSRTLGGIQQSFLDYSRCLNNKLNKKFKVFNITSTNASINNKINSEFHLLNINSWDFFSIYKLSKILTRINPKAIIAHGNRAIKFAYYARILSGKKDIKLIGVGHSHNHKWITKCDIVIGVSEEICKYMEKHEVESEKIVYIPNMIEMENDFSIKKMNHPPVIGAMSRMVAKKGINVFLEAVRILKAQKIEFKVLIAGDGELLDDMIDLSNKNKTNDIVTFLGWITDKNSFYKQIDIFCLPSIMEPFGIVILEAMHNSKLVVTTAIDGPKEIIKDGYNGFLCESKNPQDMASKLLLAINKKDEYAKITKNAYENLMSNYSMRAVGEKLVSFLDKNILK